MLDFVGKIITVAGRKPYKPSDKDRGMVEAMSGLGIPEEEICNCIINPKTGKPIDSKTLRLHYRQELDTAFVKRNLKVAQCLFKNATENMREASQIFWLKTRAGWKETQKIEHEDVGITSDSLAKLSPDELALFEKLIAKMGGG